MKSQVFRFPKAAALTGLISLLFALHQSSTAQTNTVPPTSESKLLKILKSDAPPDEKAITCKHLAIYGTKESVPALAALLSDEKLASWARIPLEVIPGPAADSALRDAARKLNGKLLVGVI